MALPFLSGDYAYRTFQLLSAQVNDNTQQMVELFTYVDDQWFKNSLWPLRNGQFTSKSPVRTTIRKVNIASIFSMLDYELTVDPLLNMPILGSSSSAANNDMMAKLWMNEDKIVCLSRKHCGKRRNC